MHITTRFKCDNPLKIDPLWHLNEKKYSFIYTERAPHREALSVKLSEVPTTSYGSECTLSAFRNSLSWQL